MKDQIVIGKLMNKTVCLTVATLYGLSLPMLAIPRELPPTSRMTQQVWNLKDADIRAIIQTVSMITGKTFIIDPRVQGKVTFISQHPMSVNELYNAFLSMLQVLNYAAVPGGGVTKIVPSVDANSMNNKVVSRFHPGAGDELVVRVVPINNVSAIQLIPVLRPLMPQWSSITAYSPSNSLILASTAANINHLVKIINKMDSRSENETSIITLKHANAENIVSVVTKLQSGERALGKTPNVSVAADKLSNTILISGNLNNISTMKSLITQMDNRATDSTNAAKVVFLNYLSAKKLAPVLNKIANGQENDAKGKGTTATDSNSKVSVQAEPDNDNALIIRAPNNIMSQLVNVIKRLDVRPQQVLVEAIIVKMNESLLKQLGIVWGTVISNTGTPDNPNAPGQPINNGAASSPSNTFALKIAPGGFGFMQNSSLQVLIHALSSDASTDILSTPTIVVLNGQKATISDGQNVGIVNRSYQNSSPGTGSDVQGLGVPYNTIERKDITLSLTVTPQISPNHTLRLKITQQDDSLASQIDPGTPGSDNPVIDTSKITTNVLVRSGDILVLGGLVDHSTKKNDQKVPFLGSIPLIGRLFSYTNHDVEKKDLMIFLKPVIINTNYERRKATLKKYHYMRGEMLGIKAGPTLHPNDSPVLPNIPSTRQLNRDALPAPYNTRKKRSHYD
jgi:general secretion pathway protein D